MAGKYHRADKGPYLRITVSIIAAILLYVPAGYLIDTNISVQKSGLYAKYGIQYNCSPENMEELEKSIQEYRRLAEQGGCGSMLCISLNTRGSIRTNVLSRELQDALSGAGWKEVPELTVDATLFFVDDATFTKCLQMSTGEGSKTGERSRTWTGNRAEDGNRAGDTLPFATAILYNRYTNRGRWTEEDVFFRETSLVADETGISAVKVYYDFINEYEPGTDKFIVPDLMINEIPEGIDFTGSMSLILPLSSMDKFCPSQLRYGMMWVCGKFEDGF